MLKKHIKVSFLIQMMFLVLLGVSARAQDKKHLAVGDPVPAFSLTDQDGKAFDIKNEIGKHILVIYFYPKDESMVCTKEACSFRDSFNDFTNAGAKVIGINSGTVASHKSFSDHYKLPFILLSDPDNKVRERFKISGMWFFSGRQTFVIGLDGKVAFQYSAMLEGKAHAEQALQYIKSAKK